MNREILALSNITKEFPGVKALNDVSLNLHEGEVLGLMGENGAGKSTLIKILGGVYQPDAGSITLFGQNVTIANTKEGIQLGMAIIYQELSLVPELTVAENLYLGNLPKNKLGKIDYKELYRKSSEILDLLGLNISPKTKVTNLSIGVQQLVEIGKALARNTRILVMDEPTSSLGKEEVHRLFKTVDELRSKGYGIIFISHHMEEIFEICDRVTVIRDGEVVETRPIDKWDSDSLVFAMVNRSLSNYYPKRKVTLGKTILSVNNVSNHEVKQIHFDIREGEIVGIAGIVGAGRTELLKTIFGALPITSGELKIYDQKVQFKSPRDALRQKVVMVPENRKEEGLILESTVMENISLSVLQRIANWGFVNFTSKKRMAQQGIEKFRIKTPNAHYKVSQLSGGNQQKVILSRISEVDPRVFLLDEPTRGIDVGAKVEIYNHIMDFAEKGAAVLVVSSELPELLGLADRIFVMRGRSIVADLPIEEATQEVIMNYATGGI